MKTWSPTLTLTLVASTVSADPLTCNLTGYKAMPGLTAAVADDTLTVTWDGDNNQELRLRLAIDGGTPTIKELAVRKKGGQWARSPRNVTPEFRVVSGLRRATQQQTEPLREARRRAHAGGDRQDQVGSVLGRAAEHRRQRRAAADAPDGDSADERRREPARPAAQAGRSEARSGDLSRRRAAK